MKFTINNPAFDAALGAALSALTADVAAVMGDDLHALVLGGGYGRGEGGVRDGLRPYNDLDLFFITRRRMRRLPGGLVPVLHRHAETLGVEIDCGRPLTVGDLRAWQPTLMWCELLQGHRVLHGPSDVLQRHAAHLRDAAPARSEAARLLLNRAAGLVWAQRVRDGQCVAPDPDFVRRNLFKCALALGDALLIVHGAWQPHHHGRAERLRALLRFELRTELISPALYEDALRFKATPDHVGEAPDLSALIAAWGDVFLHVERRRNAIPFINLAAYVAWKGAREPQQHGLAQLPRNLLHNLRRGQWSTRYPRERLYRSVPSMLGLCAGPTDAAAFLRLWEAFN